MTTNLFASLSGLSGLLLLNLVLVTTPCLGQETKGPPAAPNEASVPTAPAEAKRAAAPARPEKGAGIRATVKVGGSFSGQVTAVNLADRTITIRNKNLTVTFDATNPIFENCAGLEDVKPGDTVAVAYRGDGLSIRRQGGRARAEAKSGRKLPGRDKPADQPPAKQAAEALPEKAPAVEKSPQPPPGKETKRTGRPRLVRVRERSLGRSFDEVDENKDGRVTAVELSLIVPGLSMQQFREYDRSCNGFLDRSEFGSVRSP